MIFPKEKSLHISLNRNGLKCHVTGSNLLRAATHHSGNVEKCRERKMIFKFDIWKSYLGEGELQKYTYIFKSRQVA